MSDQGGTKDRVFMGLPMYSNSGGTSNQLFALAEALASSKYQGTDLQFYTHYSSDLPLCFNALWCVALNNRPFKWFAMCHSDLRPVVKYDKRVNWLDYLTDEAERLDVDCLSAVIAIKDDSPDTSTAVEDEKAWSGVRRLQWGDFTKPEITNEDEPKLLINTGIMAVRFDQPWVEDFAFSFDSWIQRVTTSEGDKFAPRSMTEDWGMSMWMRDQGLKFAATTRIGGYHLGTKQYGWPALECLKAEYGQ